MRCSAGIGAMAAAATHSVPTVSHDGTSHDAPPHHAGWGLGLLSCCVPCESARARARPRVWRVGGRPQPAQALAAFNV